MLPTEKKYELRLNNQDQIDEVVDSVTQAPTVTIIVDMNNLREAGYGGVMAEGDLAYGLIKFGNKLGRLNNILVFTDSPKNSKDIKFWNRHNIQPQFPLGPSPVEVLVALQVIDSLYKNPTDIYVFVAGNSCYADVARYIVGLGKIVALVCPKTRKVNTIKDYCSFVSSINEVADQSDNVDIYNYDFTQFIQLVYKNEKYLKFVGVKYLIERQMQLLGIRNLKTCRDVFNRASELGIVIVSTQKNIDENAKDVSKCELNLDHDLVKEVLAKIGDGDNEDDDNNPDVNE
jgi:hypothetical protein